LYSPGGSTESGPFKKTSGRVGSYGPARVVAASYDNALLPDSPVAWRALAGGARPQRVSNFHGDIHIHVPDGTNDPQAIAEFVRHQLDIEEERA
jgi:hypothetical protein